MSIAYQPAYDQIGIADAEFLLPLCTGSLFLMAWIATMMVQTCRLDL
ncbi:hypothetical protein [Bremerella sp. P1]|nr:hypothetical protein [Bremerella sp. P1]WDI44649.1 hypothetical protein PSR63_11955 [Bremerella sp. P1]